jgi:CRISPR/Cas system-associated exonuclease Cas4 (RecB family)
VPDEILIVRDGSYFILDYKTSRYTEAQDSLLPLYEVQLNGYAYIAERNRLSPVKKIALAYMEPQTGLTEENVEEVKTENGFYMPFSGKILQLNLNPEMIPRYLGEARKLYDQPSPPQSKEGCKDCLLLNNLIEKLTLK